MPKQSKADALYAEWQDAAANVTRLEAERVRATAERIISWSAYKVCDAREDLVKEQLPTATAKAADALEAWEIALISAGEDT